MAAAESVIQQRLVNLNITDNEVYTDYNKDRIIVRFPWKEGETGSTRVRDPGDRRHCGAHVPRG